MRLVLVTVPQGPGDGLGVVTAPGLGGQAWVQISGLSLASRVTLGKSLNLSGPQNPPDCHSSLLANGASRCQLWPGPSGHSRARRPRAVHARQEHCTSEQRVSECQLFCCFHGTCIAVMQGAPVRECRKPIARPAPVPESHPPLSLGATGPPGRLAGGLAPHCQKPRRVTNAPFAQHQCPHLSPHRPHLLPGLVGCWGHRPEPGVGPALWGSELVGDLQTRAGGPRCASGESPGAVPGAEVEVGLRESPRGAGGAGVELSPEQSQEDEEGTQGEGTA